MFDNRAALGTGVYLRGIRRYERFLTGARITRRFFYPGFTCGYSFGYNTVLAESFVRLYCIVDLHYSLDRKSVV